MGQLFGTKKHPKGPDFRDARWLEFDFSGTKLRVKAPPHTEPKYRPTIGRTNSNIYDNFRYSANSNQKAAHEAFDLGHIEYWPFYGLPLIHDRLGRMSFSINILRTNRKFNLFNPSDFEQFVHLFIDSQFKPPNEGWSESNKHLKEYQVPVNWSVVSINGTIWISYQANAQHLPDRITDWLTPITDQHAIFVSFGNYHRTKEMCCIDAFQTLMEQITATFEVKLSPQSLKEKAEAERRWPEAHYSREVPERAWSKAS